MSDLSPAGIAKYIFLDVLTLGYLQKVKIEIGMTELSCKLTVLGNHTLRALQAGVYYSTTDK